LIYFILILYLLNYLDDLFIYVCVYNRLFNSWNDNLSRLRSLPINT